MQSNLSVRPCFKSPRLLTSAGLSVFRSRSFKYSTDEVVIESLNRWKTIKETIEKRRNTKGFPRGTSAINLKESNEILLIMMVLVTTKRRIVLEEMSNFEIESHNFRENSELNNRVSFLKSIHEKRTRDIGFERLHTLANFKDVFEKVILKPKLHPEGGYSEAMFNKKIPPMPAPYLEPVASTTPPLIVIRPEERPLLPPIAAL